MVRRLLLFLGVALSGFQVSGQLTLQIYALPPSTPAQTSIFVAGNFNNWDPAHPAYQLHRQEEGLYSLTLSALPAPASLEFKFTGGSWTAVEGDAQGNFLPNRSYAYAGGPDTLQFVIQSWEVLDPRSGSTASPNVRIVTTDFDMPQLGRKRRIWIYLPPDYAGSNKRYPVLYMHDGQNLFDAATGFAGEWRVDETLDALGSGCIVVGIDNGGEHRIAEYSPWPTRFGNGEGQAYAAFVAQTLKPFIDKNYRTLRGRRHTGIMGSSMGGLISLFTAIEYQKTFGFAGICSPSLWITDQWAPHILNTRRKRPTRFYLLAARPESETMEAQVRSLAQTLQSAGFSPVQIAVDIDDDGAHAEWYWAREFPGVVTWWLWQ
jgi:predicted alpha/beta superfamily hydrolase